MNSVDVAIVGAGPAGAATALALSRLGVSSALIDRFDARPCVGETLPPTIRKRLIELGVWERFVAANHSPSFGTRVRWGHSAPSDNDFIFNPYGTGWHIDRARFNEMLIEAAHEAGAVTLRPARVVALTSEVGGAWRVTVRREGDDSSLVARVVVDACGRSASLARRLGAHRTFQDRMVGVVGFYAPEGSVSGSSLIRDRRTLIESVENGWWYSALQPDGRVVVVYMTDADLLPEGIRTEHSGWQGELDQTIDIRARVESHVLTARPIVVPAFSSCASPSSGAGWLAVGDAAAALDPLSGQGLSHALASAQLAANAVRRHLSGEGNALRDYARSSEGAYAQYLRARARHYASERRWQGSVFWARRGANTQ
jgi:flavin-dependent dehydrogenase